LLGVLHFFSLSTFSISTDLIESLYRTLYSSQVLHEKSIIAIVTIIVTDFLAFVMHTHKNESQEYHIFGIKFRRKIWVCVYTFLSVKKAPIGAILRLMGSQNTYLISSDLGSYTSPRTFRRSISPRTCSRSIPFFAASDTTFSILAPFPF